MWSECSLQSPGQEMYYITGILWAVSGVKHRSKIENITSVLKWNYDEKECSYPTALGRER